MQADEANSIAESSRTLFHEGDPRQRYLQFWLARLHDLELWVGIHLALLTAYLRGSAPFSPGFAVKIFDADGK